MLMWRVATIAGVCTALIIVQKPFTLSTALPIFAAAIGARNTVASSGPVSESPSEVTVTYTLKKV